MTNKNSILGSSMYVGVDIGGSKTLVAILDSSGVIKDQVKFPTPSDYEDFIRKLSDTYQGFKSITDNKLTAGGVAIPGKVDRQHGIGEYFGNLPWRHVAIKADAGKIFSCPIAVDNDANLGGLSESMLLEKHKRVLYITISTGIGTGFIVDQSIDPELADSEGGQMLLQHHGQWVKWEDFASGSAIVRRFHKRAEEITDSRTWQQIAHNLTIGFVELMALGQPDIIVIGGSVGEYFDRFEKYLDENLSHYANPLVTTPHIIKASRPNEAVVYGCYDLARQLYG